MFRVFPLIACSSLLIASGVVHGLRTDRWQTSSELAGSSERLEALPLRLGDWEGRSYEMDPRQLTIAEAAGHLSRRYVQRRTGHEISMLVLAGHGGPMSVHRPEVCYIGSGFVQAGSSDKWVGPADSPLRGNSLWVSRFVRPGPDPRPVRVLYAWSTAGDWVASDRPRLEFGPRLAVFKLYVVSRLGRPDDPMDKEPALDFLRVAVPELRKCLQTAPNEPSPDRAVANLPMMAGLGLDTMDKKRHPCPLLWEETN